MMSIRTVPRLGRHAKFLTPALLALATAHFAQAGSPFGADVISYVPAPGQWINNLNFNDPAAVLGPPSGGGTAAPDNADVLSLGGFGGAVVIRFGQTVMDHPDNYLGLDCIIFGNAYWVSNDPRQRWAEPAHVEIMRDVDSDGLPGTCPEEVWYLVPGSHTPDASTWRTQTWDDVLGDPFPPANTSWFPDDDDGQYTTSAFEVPASIYSTPGVVASAASPLEVLFGYADLSPTLKLGDLTGNNIVDDANMPPESFYTMPDNPWRIGVTPGSGGGDAFDIANAVDPQSWQPANLDGFDFVRITVAIDAVFGLLGEMSTEIDAVSAVQPVTCPGDWTGDGVIDLVDLLRARNAIGIEDPDTGFSIPGDTVHDGVHDLTDVARLRGAYLGATCD